MVAKALAPIVLFVYNRPNHTKLTIEALKQNELAKESDLIIFSDAPKNENAKASVTDVRKYIRSVRGFKSIKIIEREKNFGLANSIIEGVTKVVNKYGEIIVLEDDLITSKYFLRFMNDALDVYQNDSKVASISGYVYPIKDLPETFFIKGADCWGWATWKRAWDLFEKDGKKLLRDLEEKKLLNEFDFDGTYKYSEMLKNQIEGKNNSWAVRWYASAFLKNKLTLYPGKSLVSNIGNDTIGTHSGKIDKYKGDLVKSPFLIYKQKINENLFSKQKFKEFFLFNSSFFGRAFYIFKTIFRVDFK